MHLLTYTVCEAFFADKHITTLYSPDLTSCDAFLFLEAKVIKGTHFESIDAVKEKADELISNIN